jgi:hypothetical protein
MTLARFPDTGCVRLPPQSFTRRLLSLAHQKIFLKGEGTLP